MSVTLSVTFGLQLVPPSIMPAPIMDFKLDAVYDRVRAFCIMLIRVPKRNRDHYHLSIRNSRSASTLLGRKSIAMWRWHRAAGSKGCGTTTRRNRLIHPRRHLMHKSTKKFDRFPSEHPLQYFHFSTSTLYNHGLWVQPSTDAAASS